MSNEDLEARAENGVVIVEGDGSFPYTPDEAVALGMEIQQAAVDASQQEVEEQ